MEDNALYRPIIKRAWQMTKKFKGLWFFGLFVALLGSSGEYEVLSRLILKTYNSPGVISDVIGGVRLGIANGLANGGQLWSNVWSSLASNPSTFIFIVLIFILSVAITIFLIWLALVSQISLVRNADAISKNKKATINEGIDFAVKNFWPVTAANVIFKVVILALFFLIGREIFFLDNLGLAGQIFYYLSFAVFAIIVFILSLLFKYQIFYIILKKQGLIKAIKSAFALFKTNWLISLEMAIGLFIVQVVAAIITILVTIMLIAAPFIFTIYFHWPANLISLLSIVDLFLIIAVSFWITAMLMTYIWSSWVLLYNRLTAEGGLSKIIRLAKQLPNLAPQK